MPDAAPMMGHNAGVVDPELLADFREKVNAFAKEAKEIAKVDAITEDEAGRLTDFISGARDLYKEIDEKRIEMKRPHDERAAAVQAAFKPLLDLVEKAGKTAKQLQASYLARLKREAEERARAEREAAERAAREEAQRAAAAEEAGDMIAAEEARLAAAEAEKAAEKAAKPVKAAVKSASGAGRTVSLRTIRYARIVSINQALLHYRDHPETIALVERLANAEIRAAKGEPITIPGIAIETREEAA